MSRSCTSDKLVGIFLSLEEAERAEGLLQLLIPIFMPSQLVVDLTDPTTVLVGV